MQPILNAEHAGMNFGCIQLRVTALRLFPPPLLPPAACRCPAPSVVVGTPPAAAPHPQLWNVELDEAPVALALSPKQQLIAVATVDDSIQRAFCLGRFVLSCFAAACFSVCACTLSASLIASCLVPCAPPCSAGCGQRQGGAHVGRPLWRHKRPRLPQRQQPGQRGRGRLCTAVERSARLLPTRACRGCRGGRQVCCAAALWLRNHGCQPPQDAGCCRAQLRDAGAQQAFKRSEHGRMTGGVCAHPSLLATPPAGRGSGVTASTT